VPLGPARGTDPASVDVLIVGASHGGATAAVALRQAGFAGSIAMVTDERELPYERPPLSKEYFAGEKTLDRIRLRPPGYWADRGIGLVMGERIDFIDAVAHLARARSGRTFRYGQLVWAAGGSPRRLALPGGEASNVLYLRTLADADRLKTLSATATRIAVIGGGYIGLEAAAALTTAGKPVILIEALDRVLARVAGEELSRYVEGVHRAHGVDVRLAAAIAGFEGEGRVEAIRLADGARITCDLVVVGIGILPEIGPLQAAGARCADGVEIDARCRTSLPGIFAIGDCASHRNPYADGAMVRLESVQNAADMAKTAAECIIGSGQPYGYAPWFWSNQYDLKIQTVGLSRGHDATVVRGDRETGRFSIIYLREGRVIALDCVNATKDYVHGRALVMAGARIPRDQLAADTPLKSLFSN
jgi:3-phenylpropionate/trans-cinnamate dioxygenase ferredoxin reductase component